MRKFPGKILILVVIGLLGALLFQNSASAYTFEPYNNRLINPGHTSYSWGNNLSGPSIIKTGWQDAISDWHSAQAKVRFVYSSSSASTLDSMYNEKRSLFGRMQWNSGIYTTRFHGFMNTYANHKNQKITDSRVAKSTGSHELGHAMGIHHVGGISIMNSSRDRRFRNKPMQDDINGINARYPYFVRNE